MTPRYQPTDGQITREQALLAVQAAGLDPSQPIDRQMAEPAAGSDLEMRVAALSEQVESLTAALGQASQPANPQAQFAEGLASQLTQAQSKWYSPNGEPDND